jgi:hypothetical protein
MGQEIRYLFIYYYILCHTEHPSRGVSTDSYAGGSGFGPMTRLRVVDRFFLDFLHF